MSEHARELIERLGLEPHPEGGHFREVFRSQAQVNPQDGRGERAALTTIYFLLQQGEVSRLHQVASDEVWHHLEGAALELFSWDAEFQSHEQTLLGPLASEGAQPVAVVPPGCWQGARSTGNYTLVGCTVGPGFDFADFRMLSDDPAAAEAFRKAAPEWELLA